MLFIKTLKDYYTEGYNTPGFIGYKILEKKNNFLIGVASVGDIGVEGQKAFGQCFPQEKLYF